MNNNNNILYTPDMLCFLNYTSSTSDHVSTTTSDALDYEFLENVFAILFVILPMILLIAMITAAATTTTITATTSTATIKKNKNGSMMQCFMSWIILPLFCIITFIAYSGSAVALGTLVGNSDFCYGGGANDPKASVSDILLLYQPPCPDNANFIHDTVMYYIDQCPTSAAATAAAAVNPAATNPLIINTNHPFSTISDYYSSTQFLALDLDVLIQKIGGIMDGALSSTTTTDEDANQDCKTQLNTIEKLALELNARVRVLAENAATAFLLVRCENAQPIYEKGVEIGTCTYSVTALTWCFASLLIIGTFGNIMILLRSSWLPVEYVYVKKKNRVGTNGRNNYPPAAVAAPIPPSTPGGGQNGFFPFGTIDEQKEEIESFKDEPLAGSNRPPPMARLNQPKMSEFQAFEDENDIVVPMGSITLQHETFEDEPMMQTNTDIESLRSDTPSRKSKSSRRPSDRSSRNDAHSRQSSRRPSNGSSRNDAPSRQSIRRLSNGSSIKDTPSRRSSYGSSIKDTPSRQSSRGMSGSIASAVNQDVQEFPAFKEEDDTFHSSPAIQQEVQEFPAFQDEDLFQPNPSAQQHHNFHDEPLQDEDLSQPLGAPIPEDDRSVEEFQAFADNGNETKGSNSFSTLETYEEELRRNIRIDPSSTFSTAEEAGDPNHFEAFADRNTVPRSRYGSDGELTSKRTAAALGFAGNRPTSEFEQVTSIDEESTDNGSDSDSSSSGSGSDTDSQSESSLGGPDDSGSDSEFSMDSSESESGFSDEDSSTTDSSDSDDDENPTRR